MSFKELLILVQCGLIISWGRVAKWNRGTPRASEGFMDLGI